MMTLLVVDDDRDILDLMAAILTSQGYEDVVYAQSGEEALSLVNQGQHQFSTFILDIQMPGMDGVDLCGRIRAISEHRRTPIIMLTAMRDKEHIDAAFLRGATDYLTKPIDTTDLSARLNVAQLLFNEQQSTLNATRREENLRLDMGNKSNSESHFDLADAVSIFDVPRVLGNLEMENYLHRLSRGKRFMCGAICFQIQRRERLFSMTSPLEFHGILTDVAEAIFETLRSYNVMISYVGNGQYVAILPRTLQLDEAELELNLSLKLREFGLIEGDSVPLDVTIKVGDIVRMSMFDASPEALIARAISKAELKSAQPRSTQIFDPKRKSIGF
jgi:DNA-binding response OmpR family regulator